MKLDAMAPVPHYTVSVLSHNAAILVAVHLRSISVLERDIMLFGSLLYAGERHLLRELLAMLALSSR